MCVGGEELAGLRELDEDLKRSSPLNSSRIGHLYT